MIATRAFDHLRVVFEADNARGFLTGGGVGVNGRGILAVVAGVGMGKRQARPRIYLRDREACIARRALADLAAHARTCFQRRATPQTSELKRSADRAIVL